MEQITEETKIETSYRIVFGCCVVFIIMIIGVCCWQTNDLREKNRVLGTENDSLRTRCEILQTQCDSITDWRKFMKESNPQKIYNRLDRDKSFRVHGAKIDIE
jgi:hypothetical protein